MMNFLQYIQRAPQFYREVRQEMRKVTWPSLKETRITTIIVFILAIIAAIYFIIVDQIIYRVLNLLIG